MPHSRDNATKTISVMMLLTLAGKALGLYRDRLLAVSYSVGVEASAFFTASRIPRVFFDAVFASAITACFIPVFSEYLERKSREEAERFAGAFLTLMVLLTAGLTAAGMLAPQAFVALFADYSDPGTTALAVSLTRVMFPTVLFSGAAFSLVGILQAQDHFTAPALMSAASNLVIILYFLGLNSRLGIYGLAAAYLLGWLIQGVIQVPPLRRLGFRFRPSLEFRTAGMKKVVALMAPVMVSTWVQPITLAINSRFGSRLYGGAGVAAMEYSTNLYLVIAGTFILSVTNVIFPRLSRMTAGGREGDFRQTLRQTVHGSLFFVLPMGVGLAVVSRPLIELIYGGGEFDRFAADITSAALAWLSLGMAGYAVQNILSRAYFARQEGRAPLAAGLASIGVSAALCALLAGPLKVAGLAIASAVSSTVYALLLDLPLERRGEGVFSGGAAGDYVKMLLASLGMGAAAWGVLALAGPVLAGKAGLALSLGAAAAAGGAVYFLLTLALGLEEARIARDGIKQFLKRG
ncbi:MAG: murein biosynthesis integral membrane protein MurJ [Lawsonibacter sp.]|nr:murein biosynthesis integral membrane protein MurJ [Lawsonibacter sp.]